MLATSSGKQQATTDRLELEIVDTFTRLIFSDEAAGYSRTEKSIINCLKSFTSPIGVSSNWQLGEYLSELNVSEMTKLVAKIKARLE